MVKKDALAKKSLEKKISGNGHSHMQCNSGYRKLPHETNY